MSVEVQGRASAGSAVQGRPVLVAGSDGTNVRLLNVDTNGNLKTAVDGVAYTNRSIANLSGASETLMPANTARRILIIHNPSANAMAVNLVGGTAALNTAGSIELAAGERLIIDRHPPTSAITIIGTLNDDVTAYEG